MSLNKVQAALEDFAMTSDDKAIIFKGAWGTGKTFLWDMVVKQKKQKFIRSKYSYVSLFGINSLAELKRSIFESSVDKNFADESPSLKSLTSNLTALKSSMSSWFRKIIRFGSEASIPYVKGVGSLIESVQYASICDITICIDDFERKGSALTDRDVLGLISNLVEKKRCRVVLILNEKTLNPQAEFFSFSEKVFDYEILFKPTVAEAISMVFKSGSETERKLVYHLTALEINNIRLLKKIDLFLRVLKPYFDRWQVEITNQALHVLPLAVLAIYGGKETLADLEVIKSLDHYETELPDGEENKSAEEKAAFYLRAKRREFLSNYGFTFCDEFDAAIIELVRQGYADDDLLLRITDAMHKKVKHDQDFAVYKTAWSVFKGSFEMNEEEVFRCFEDALELVLPKLTLQQLDQVSSVYEVISHEQTFQRHIDRYFEMAINNDYFDPDDFHTYPKYPYLTQALENYKRSKIVRRSLYEIFESSPKIGPSSDDDVRSMSMASVDEYYNFIKSMRGSEIPFVIGKCLRLGGDVCYSPELQESHFRILVATYEAILRIAGESKLNSHRLSKFLADYEKKYSAAKILSETLASE